MVVVHQTNKPIDETILSDHDADTLREMAGKAFFAGGYARWLYVHTFSVPANSKLDLLPSDKDLFGYAEALDNSIVNSIYELGFAQHIPEGPMQNETLLINFTHPDVDDAAPLQFVRPIASPALYSAGNPVKQLQRFNFYSSQFAVEMQGDDVVFFYTDEGVLDLKRGRLRINAINSPLGMMRRIVKDTSKGFIISLKEMMKLFTDWDARSDEYQASVVNAVNNMGDDAGAWDLDYRLYYEEKMAHIEQLDLNKATDPTSDKAPEHLWWLESKAQGEGMGDSNIDGQWEEGLLELCTPDSFTVSIHYSTGLMRRLAEVGYSAPKLEEIMTRMTPKIKMIEGMAAKQVSGMLKGTLKYRHDEHSIDEWIDYMLDDGGDGLNYGYLLAARLRALVPVDIRARKGPV